MAFGIQQLQLSQISCLVAPLAFSSKSDLMVCVCLHAGGRKGKPVHGFLIKAYIGGQKFNPELHKEGPHYYFFTQCGNKKWLSNTMEGFQFALQCRCGHEHFRFTTLKTIKTEDHLFCQYCEHATEWWRASRKYKVYSSDIQGMAALHTAKLQEEVACQVRLLFWPGRVDFFHMPSKTIVNVDGSSHFTGMFYKTRKEKLNDDIECCAKAWSKGVRLLRLHHQHAGMDKAMLAAIQLPHSKFIMLSTEYIDVRVLYNGQQLSYVEWVKACVGCTQCELHHASDCIILW